MKKRHITLTLTLAAAMSVSVCGTASFAALSETDEDTIVALLPPVSEHYQEKIDEWVAQYEEEHPNITIELTKASWEDAEEKLNVQVNAGSPPDVSFVSYDVAGKYVDLGMGVNILDYLDEEKVNDFNQEVLRYFQIGDAVYGLPAYCDIHSIGGNREMLEAAGVDWKSVQQNGWTYEEFREAIKNGVIREGDETKTYGFVFACSGVTANDFFTIFSKNAGMPAEFDEDLKYVYTSPRMLSFLEDIRALIDDGSMPDFLTSIDAGKRWNMFLTGQTMITGKGLTSFEKSAAKNNALLEEGGEAVEDSIPVEYVVLPVPTFNGAEQAARANVDGYICLTGELDPDEQHLRNAADFAYFLSSGERAAVTCQEVYNKPVCSTGTEAYDELPAIENRSEDNLAAVDYLVSHISPARPDIPTEKTAAAQKIKDEVIIPKFQGLLAGELTAEDMYKAIQDAAFDVFGEAECVTE